MSLCARSRWTWARASSPVIHLDSPEGSAILPSIESASLSVMRGRPRSMPAQIARHAVAGRLLAPMPVFTSIPALPKHGDALAGGARVGILEGDDDARDSGAGNDRGAGRAAARWHGRRAQAWCRASRPSPACPPRPARPPRHGAGRPSPVAPRPTILPSLTMTQPTLGLGAVRPRAASPSRTASIMNSASLNAELLFKLLEFAPARFLGLAPFLRRFLLVGHDVGVGPLGPVILDIGDGRPGAVLIFESTKKMMTMMSVTSTASVAPSTCSRLRWPRKALRSLSAARGPTVGGRIAMAGKIGPLALGASPDRTTPAATARPARLRSSGVLQPEAQGDHRARRRRRPRPRSPACSARRG